MTASSKTPAKRVPLGLARVRKELAPPGKIFKSKKNESRKRAKERLQHDLKSSLPDKSS